MQDLARARIFSPLISKANSVWGVGVRSGRFAPMVHNTELIEHEFVFLIALGAIDLFSIFQPLSPLLKSQTVCL